MRWEIDWRQTDLFSGGLAWALNRSLLSMLSLLACGLARRMSSCHWMGTSWIHDLLDAQVLNVTMNGMICIAWSLAWNLAWSLAWNVASSLTSMLAWSLAWWVGTRKEDRLCGMCAQPADGNTRMLTACWLTTGYRKDTIPMICARPTRWWAEG